MTKLFKFPSRETVDPMIDEDLDYLESIIEWKKLMVMALQQQIEEVREDGRDLIRIQVYQDLLECFLTPKTQKGGIGTECLEH